MQNMASRPRSLHDDLTNQLSFFDCEPIIREIAEYIIYNLDDDGLPQHDLHNVVRDFGGLPLLNRPRKRSNSFSAWTRRASVHATCASACFCSSPPTSLPRRLQILISQHLDDLRAQSPPRDREENRNPDREDQGGDRAPSPAEPAARCRVRRSRIRITSFPT